MSKSSDFNIAYNFSQNGTLFLFIYENINSLYIESITNFEGEEEYLSFPGEVFEIYDYYNIYDAENIIYKKCWCCKIIDNLYNLNNIDFNINLYDITIDKKRQKIIDDINNKYNYIFDRIIDDDYLILSNRYIYWVFNKNNFITENNNKNKKYEYDKKKYIYDIIY